jgi:hypothetical protein
MSTSTAFTSRTEGHLKFTEKVAVKLTRGVGDKKENEESFFQLTIRLGLCPLRKGEYLFTYQFLEFPDLRLWFVQ